MSEQIKSDAYRYQTRSESTGIDYHETMAEAISAAEKDQSIWKISFSTADERIRLVRNGDCWVYEPLMNEVSKAMEEVS